METLIVILFMVLGLFIIHIPWAFYGKAKKFTGRVLGAAFPRFRWIDKGFLIYNAVIWLGSIALLGMIGIRQDIDPTTMVYTGQFAAIAAFHGLFAALVAVCPVPTPKKYVYIYQDTARFVGLLQMFLGISAMVAAYFSIVLTTTQ